MAAKKKTTIKSKSAPRRRTTNRAARRKSGGNEVVANVIVPLVLIVFLAGCLVFLALSGFRAAAGSDFFVVRQIDIRGAEYAPKGEITKVVESYAANSGVWDADLDEIRRKIEKIAFVKTVAVSRLLPDGIRVTVTERTPRAVVRVTGADFWVDDEGLVIAPARKGDAGLPFTLLGWSEPQSTENDAASKNINRLKVYRKLLDDSRQIGVADRIKSVDLTNSAQPRVVIEDSGENVEIILGKDNFAKKLEFGFENVTGKGKQVTGLDVSEVTPKWTFRTTK